jgi:hypothetical protein
LIEQRRGQPFRWAGERVELRDGAGRRDREPARVDGQRRPFQVSQVDQPVQMNLRFREQPGAACEPSIACRPNGQLGARARPGNFSNGVQIQESASTFNAIGLSVTVLQDQRQLDGATIATTALKGRR